MKAITAVIGFGSALLLLYLGAEVLSDTVDVWAQVKAAPAQFLRFVTQSYSHEALWTALVVIGVAAAIAYVRGVPVIKAR